jgi:hypothetical protein
LRLILYPWGIWSLIAWLPRKVRERYIARRRLAWLGTYAVQWSTYLVVGLPVTLMLTGEILISLNEAVLAEQADYRLQSDFDAPSEGATFEVPGPPSYTPEPVPKAQDDAYYRYLVELYSPVIYQKMSNHPEWDIPLLMDFDGNEDPRDNVDNEPRFRPHVAGVYGEMTAETVDSYYLTYSLYHVKDYDHPIREAISRWTYHDNDNEGFHIRVDKATMAVAEVETWFHNRFLLFNNTGVSTGTEPVHGKIHVEDGTHVIVYAQPQGHGVRLAQLVDLEHLDHNVKILRYRGDREAVPIRADRKVQIDGTYEIENFDSWYRWALGPFGSQGKGPGIFEEVIPLGQYPDGSPRVIGRFIAGRDYDINGWSRPKPMWSWDDGWDEIPIFVWHFFPSLSFQSHGGTQLSHEYLYNRPCDKVFGEPPPVVAQSLQLPLVMRREDKWKPLEGRGGKLDSRLYWIVAKKAFRSYVNYLFHALG